MGMFMESIRAVPVWAWGIAALAVVSVAAACRELLIRAGLGKMVRESAAGTFKGVPPRQAVLRPRINWLEKAAARENVRIFDILDVSASFLSDFKRSRSQGSMHRLLLAYPRQGMVEAFRACLAKQALRDTFLKRLAAEDGSALLTHLALENRGDAFDGKAASVLFAGRMGEIRELSGDPEWPVRYFCATILLEDGDETSERLLWEFLSDSARAVRTLVASSFAPGDTERLFAALMAMYLRDPARETRAAAKARISRDMPARLKVDPSVLDDIESIHALELLEPGSTVDENLALQALEGLDLERRLVAARFLDSTGVLSGLLSGADLGDGSAYRKTLARLENAAEAGVCGFLSGAQAETRPAPVCAALTVLTRHGDRSLVSACAKKAFEARKEGKSSPDLEDLYSAALKCVRARGDERAVDLVVGELLRSKDDPATMRKILLELPDGFDSRIAPVLMDLLFDPAVVPEAELREATAKMETSLVLPRAISLVRGENGGEAMETRRRALRLLCSLGVPYVIQFVMESLPFLPAADIPVFSALVSGMDEKTWNDRAGYALSGTDAPLRAAVIRALSDKGKKTFLKEIRGALSDADPDVRVAAITSLAEFDESKFVNTSGLALLRDPVERVRTGTAVALGKICGEGVIDLLKANALDPNETDAVVEASIRGLGESPLAYSVDALAGIAAAGMESPFALSCARALAMKTERKTLQRLLEVFKDAGAGGRSVVVKGFAFMGEKGEQALLALLGEEISSLRPYICEALEATGFVDLRIARLSHRNPAERRAAALDLSLIATVKAFKGIVLAARDPDPEIRVLVAKALDFLNSPSGEGILKELNGDPDRKVRKYTAWAVERCAARSDVKGE